MHYSTEILLIAINFLTMPFDSARRAASFALVGKLIRACLRKVTFWGLVDLNAPIKSYRQNTEHRWNLSDKSIMHYSTEILLIAINFLTMPFDSARRAASFALVGKLIRACLRKVTFWGLVERFLSIFRSKFCPTTTTRCSPEWHVFLRKASSIWMLRSRVIVKILSIDETWVTRV